MSDNLNEQVVVAFFSTPDMADGAAEALMRWDGANDDIKLGTIGRLTWSEKGKLESKRYTGTGAGRSAAIGAAIGLLAGAVTGGLSLVAGALGGGAIGGVAGALGRDSLGLTDAGLEQIKAKLQPGTAALLVLCDDEELAATLEQLTAAGGEAQSFGVSEAVLSALHEAGIHDQRESDFLNYRGAGLY